MARSIPGLVGVLALWPGVAAADEAEPAAEPAEPPAAESTGIGPLTGKLFSYGRVGALAGDVQQISASTWLQAQPKLGDTSSAKLALAFDLLETSLDGTRGLRIRLREAWVAYKKAGWLLRGGQQIIPWGSGDGVNPTDFLTARNFAVFSADTEDNREGATSVMVSKAFASGLEFTVVATPIHPASTLLIPLGTLPAGTIVTPAATATPDIADTEVAGKIKRSGTGWDLAVVGFRGFQHLPELEPGATGGVALVHHRLFGGGIDGSASVGRTTVRLEAAYVVTANPRGELPNIQPSYAAGVLGVERPFGERVRVQLQIAGRFHPNYRSPDTLPGGTPADDATKQVAIANALLHDYVDRFRGAATARFAYKSASEKLELELFGAIDVAIAGYFVRPRIGYHATDALTLDVGYEGYGGDRTRPLGARRDFSAGYAQATFVF